MKTKWIIIGLIAFLAISPILLPCLVCISPFYFASQIVQSFHELKLEKFRIINSPKSIPKKDNFLSELIKATLSSK